MDRLRESEALRAAALAVSGAGGEAVFGELVQVLVRILGVEAAMISIFADGDRSRMRTLATWLDGRLLESFEYELARTPCAGVIGREFRYVGSSAAAEFAPGTMFHEKAMDAYSAYSLNAPDGAQLGLIAVVDRKPLPDAALVEPLLKIFAVRAVAEIERARAEAALKASEASYRAIFEASEDTIFVHDWDSGAILEANARACEMYGYSVEELRRASIGQLSAPEPAYSDARASELIEQAKSQAEPLRFEWRGRHRDGHLMWHEVTLKPAILAGQRRLLAFVRDITERKAANEALAASEAQYRAIFNASADALLLWDSSLRRVDVNPAYERIYGWRPDEVIGRGFEGRGLSPEYWQPRLELVRRSLAGETCRLEIEAMRKSGERFTAEITTIPFVHRGEPHVLAIVRDVTARKSEQELLRASEEQYRAIFNAAADALVLRDAEFRIVDVNPAYEAMSGYARQEVLGLDRITANPPEIEAQVRALHARALAGEAVMLETVLVSKDGTHREAEVRGVPIRHGGAPHVLYIGRDISERNAVEQRLRQAQKMEAIGQLAGGIAHDFNNLLASIMGFVVLASEREAALADPKLTAHLDQALASCRRARDLIQQMLTFSRGRRATPRPLALGPVVETAMKLLRGSLPATLEIRSALVEAPLVALDRVQIEQVLMNLLINARDATGGVGRVDIVVQPTALAAKATCASCRNRFRGDYLELSVSDNGPGIPPEVLERIFEPFFTTKEVGRGSGMGLATVHGIVHEHGGHVLLETARGTGSRFRVLLPLAAGDAAPSARTPARAARSRARLRGRVLVVDDEASVSEFMRELLESWGLAVQTATDPRAARDQIARDPGAYDVVIVDQTMPGTTGMGLASELIALRPGLPILLYSGRTDVIAERDAAAAGIRAVLQKPVEPDLLYGLLSAHLH
jgi:PAS domain S-box-containing protein